MHKVRDMMLILHWKDFDECHNTTVKYQHNNRRHKAKNWEHKQRVDSGACHAVVEFEVKSHSFRCKRDGRCEPKQNLIEQPTDERPEWRILYGCRKLRKENI